MIAVMLMPIEIEINMSLSIAMIVDMSIVKKTIMLAPVEMLTWVVIMTITAIAIASEIEMFVATQIARSFMMGRLEIRLG